MNKKIFTLGPKGTFSDLAATKLDPEKKLPIVYVSNLPMIAKAVEQDALALGILPIENSTVGMLGPAQVSLQRTQVKIVKQIEIPVFFTLVADTAVQQIQTLYAHPVAYEQCANFIADHLPQANVIYTESNIYAGKTLLANPNQKCAALVPKLYAEQSSEYKKLIQIPNVQDTKDNRTRFFVIEPRQNEKPFDFTRNKTSVVIQTSQDQPSLLFDILREFHTFEINLCSINSRPSTKEAWCYDFFIDFFNNQYTEKCLHAIAERKIDYKILGSYDLI